MRKILAGAIVAAVVLGFVGAGAGHAQTASDTEQGLITTVTIGELGTRVIAPLAPVAMVQSSAATLTGTMAVSVIETARSGNNPWNVTVEIDDVFKGTLNAANTIPVDALTISSRDTLNVDLLGAGTQIVEPALASETFSAANVALGLYSVTGQLTTSLYTNTYNTTAALQLTLPSNTARDAYTTNFTVTLLQ